jgi:hypothetical protein
MIGIGAIEAHDEMSMNAGRVMDGGSWAKYAIRIVGIGPEPVGTSLRCYTKLSGWG